MTYTLAFVIGVAFGSGIYQIAWNRNKEYYESEIARLRGLLKEQA